ncbi:MAG: hypothetical protein KDA61_07520, partial [Planctomycetales bacterium]|nr:hypothetical protein [Planctomycetales bacterium]
IREDAVRVNRRRLSQWLHWASYSTVSFPRIVLQLDSVDDQLQRASIQIVREARFNVPIPRRFFQLGAPAGSTLVDSRRAGRPNYVARLNRDVFDAASQEEVQRAVKPLDEAFTETELAAFDELRRIYVLSQDEVLQRFEPPFSLSHRYLPRMMSPNYVGPRYDEFYYIMSRQEHELRPRHSYDGLAPTLSNLIASILEHPLVDVEIPVDVLQLKLPGDYLLREGATREELVVELSKIVSRELDRPVQLAFYEVERAVYVARGEFAVADSVPTEPRGRPLLAVNSGDYSGDHGESIHFGDISELLEDVGEYIGMKIIDETTSSDQRLAWSERWYDRPDLASQGEFQIDPAFVLRLVADQTGLQFVESSRTTRILGVIGE